MQACARDRQAASDEDKALIWRTREKPFYVSLTTELGLKKKKFDIYTDMLHFY